MLVVVAKGQSGNAENIIRIKYTNVAYTQAPIHIHVQTVRQTAVTSTQLTFQLFLQMAQRELAAIKRIHTNTHLSKQKHIHTVNT